MNQSRHVRIQVFGIVQGVGFRYFTAQEAIRLHLTGRATNLNDGSVEVFAQGEHDAIEALQSWLMKGPRTAQVDRIELTELESSAEYSGFRAY